jgi:hypothetical protein
MTSLKEWIGDTQQRLMTNLVNRSCKINPTFVDRLAIRLMARLLGEMPHDPELDHPEAE